MGSGPNCTQKRNYPNSSVATDEFTLLRISPLVTDGLVTQNAAKGSFPNAAFLWADARTLIEIYPQWYYQTTYLWKMPMIRYAELQIRKMNL